jgi:hypothetical protein
MNHHLAVSILSQFDNELSMMASACSGSMDFQEKCDYQSKLESLIKQRGESLQYMKKELSK